jgi:hypothetical protein
MTFKINLPLFSGFLVAVSLSLFFFFLKPFFYKNTLSPAVLAQSVSECSKDDTANWCQAGRDPQHTGFTPANLGTNFKVIWTYAFQPERVHPQVQAIVYQGKVYIGTEMGNLYAINAQTGVKVWAFKADGPILNSVAAGNNKIYFATNKGSVYALNATEGTQVWKRQVSVNRPGFSTAPIIGDNKILIGSRHGKFYAFDINTGVILWTYDTGSPILMTAAYNQGRVFFGAMDMFVYALNTSNGSLAWKSPKIDGISFKLYYPVVYQNKVIVLPLSNKAICGLLPGSPFSWGTSAAWLDQYGATIAAGNATQVADFMNTQNTLMAKYLANPTNYNLMVNILNETDGQLEPRNQIPHADTQAHNGEKTPPCVDREGKLIVPVLFTASGWGRVDLASQRYIDVLYDGKNWNGQDYIIRNANNQPVTNGSAAGFGNTDENLNVSCTANSILGFHIQEGNANYTGVFNLDTRRWTRIAAGYKNREMFNNNQSGGGNPPTIAGNIIYHQSFNELIARTTN